MTITHFHEETTEQVKRVLLHAQANRLRIRLFYGDKDTGKSWHEENDVCGYIGNTTGSQKHAILRYNSRSIGGGMILDHCIVAIQCGKEYLYKHENFDVGQWCIKDSGAIKNITDLRKFTVFVGDKEQATFLEHKKAVRYMNFMKGERAAK